MLGESFVNTWVLAKDLDGIAAASKDESLERLCTLLEKNYDYPVDTVLLSPELKILGQRDVMTSVTEESSAYAAFLRKALEDGEPTDEGR